MPAVVYCPQSDTIHRPADKEFLIHYHPLADRFRNRLKLALQQHPEVYKTLTSKQLRALSPSTSWNVQLQHVGKGKTALRYLARYVQRSAFHPSRILGLDPHGNIRLSWRSSQTGKLGTLHLSPHEFIRRWLQHVLPKGFTRVRHYGFGSSAAVKTRLRVRAHLGEIGEPLPQLPDREPFACQHCGGELIFQREIKRIQKLNPHRGPPSGKLKKPLIKSITKKLITP